MRMPYLDEEMDEPKAFTETDLPSDVPEERPISRAERERLDIEAAFRRREERLAGLDQAEERLDSRPSPVSDSAPLAKGILAAQMGFNSLIGGSNEGIRATQQNIDAQVSQEQAGAKSLRDRILAKRKDADRPLADMSLRNRLMGENRKERIGEATEGNEITKSNQEVTMGGLKLEGAERTAGDEKAARDPKSPESVNARQQTVDFLEKEATAFETAKQPELARRAKAEAQRISNSEMTKQQLEGYKTTGGMMGKDFLSDQRMRENAEENRRAREENARIMAGVRKEERDDKVDANQKAKLEKSTQALSKRLTEEGLPSLQTQLTEIDGQLRTAGGKVSQIDGMGTWERMSPDMIYNLIGSQEGKNFRGALQGAANTLIKSRSGAAVTTAEEKRLLLELQQGKFSSPDDVQNGIKAIRNVYNKILQNIAGGFNAETKGAYKEQGGLSLDPLQDPAGNKQAGPSQQEKAAMDWLNKNPNDPRAEAIRERLKAKGLIK